MSVRPRHAIPLLFLAATASALADGGVVRHVESAGPWRVTVFTSPTPLRAGPIDLSVLVQDAATAEAVLDARVDVAAERADVAMHGAATRADATNRMLYASLLTLPSSGEWSFLITVARGDESESFSFPASVEPPLPPWQTYWPWFAIPLVGLGLFVAHQAILIRRTGGARIAFAS